MKKRSKELTFIFLRYILLLLLGIFLNLFYLVFIPLTIYPVYFILSLIYGITLSGTSLITSFGVIEIVRACIAGSAYYLLLILNLSTPMRLKIRIKSLLFILFSLLIINILRIILFSILFLQGFSYFNLTHLLVWYVLSIVFVTGIWILNIFLFKIKSIPIYSDFKKLLRKKPN